ncbi:MAG: ATP-binding protein [Phycisphaerae bacterium]
MRSIRHRLTWQLLMVIGVLSLIGGILIYAHVHRALRRQFDDTLKSKAMALGRLVAWGKDGKLILEIPQDALLEFRRPKRPDYFEVWRPDGSVFARSDSLKGGDLDPPALHRGAEACEDMTLADGRPGRVVTFPFVPHSEADESDDQDPAPPGGVKVVRTPVVLALAEDRMNLDATLAHIGEGLVVVWCAMGLITAGTLALTVKGGLRPLERLSEEAGRLDSETLHSRFSTDALPAELAPIVERLNQSLGRIGAAFDRERRFAADAAHELRTPIAELRSQAEVIMKWPRERGDAVKEFREVHAVARQMERLVESLLAMGRCAAKQQRMELRKERLDLLAEEAWRGFEEQAAARRVTVRWELRGAAEVTTDRVLLMPVLRNVFSNAVEYSPAGSEVRCTVEGGADGSGGAELIVVNATEGLTREDTEHLFEPFWRKDRSRTGTEHSGLGLAVAAEYAELLGIKLQARLLEDGRFCMRVLFGRVRAEAPAGTGAAAVCG